MHMESDTIFQVLNDGSSLALRWSYFILGFQNLPKAWLTLIHKFCE